ncbi:MAG: efflux RND transporter periplasmic adaptor subunit [Symploca sp. SIO1A3]|nr:efflux RND transporter periplasmic adaptor subunit [Symploca sp. SIO1A3]
MEIPKIGKVKRPFSWLIGLITAGILVVIGAGYFIMAARPSKINLDELTVPVETQDFTLRITSSGEVEAIKNVNLSPKTAGILEKLYVEQGDRIEQGQELARMESEQLQAQLLRAQAELKQTQARLAQAQAGNRTEEINQAEARLTQAQARLNEALAGNPKEIEQAKAQVEIARSQLNLAQGRVKRNRSLSEQGAISQDQFDQVTTEARNAQATLTEAQQRLEQIQNTKNSDSPAIEQLQASVQEAAFALQQLRNGTRREEITQQQAAVEAAQAQVRIVQVQLEETVIKAPFSGIVSQEYAVEGAFVTPTTEAAATQEGNSSAIVEISQGLKVVAKVTEVDVGQIKPGQSVEIIADAFPDQVFQGNVKRIPSAAVEDNSGVISFEVQVALSPEAQQELLSGMKVDLTFLGEKVSNALLIPIGAVVTEGGQTGVMIPNEDNQPQFKSVTIGSTIQDQIEILEGLEPGERVFIALPKGFRN